MKITVLWCVSPCNLVDIYRFKEYCCVQLQSFYSEDEGSRLLLIFGKYQFTRRYITTSQKTVILPHRRKNLTSHNFDLIVIINEPSQQDLISVLVDEDRS
jgi:hypothetical protein